MTVKLTAIGVAILAFLCTASSARGQSAGPRFINPSGLARSAGYTHVVVSSDGRTAYIAGQVALDSTGALVGAAHFAGQAEQVFANLRRALESVGASFEDIMKTTIYITDIKNLPALREARERAMGKIHPPASTLIQVQSLARPELLLEIEAVVDLGRAR